jgi:hypothetical protein
MTGVFVDGIHVTIYSSTMDPMGHFGFDLQKMGRTIRFDDGKTCSPMPFHGYSPIFAYQFWVFVFFSPVKAVQMVAVMAIY